MVGFIYLYKICTPWTNYRKTLFIFVVTGFSFCSIFEHDFFSISAISIETIMVFAILSIFSIFVYKFLNKLSEKYILNNIKIIK